MEKILGEFKVTRNLITGIGGFVASHLADYLISLGEEVYGTYRWTEDLSKIQHIKDKIKLIPMDLNDLSSCMKAIEQVKPDYVYHLAAQSFVNDSFIYPEETLRTNIIGTYNLLEAIRMSKECSPVIHVCSSSEVYGQVQQNEVPIKETNPFRPANPYAVSKVGEDMIAYLYWLNHKMKIIRTRMFTHTGPRRSMESAEIAFAKQIVKIEKGLQEPVIKVGNLNSVRTFADVRDAVRAYYALAHKCKFGEVYNIGGREVMTIGEMLNKLISFSKYNGEIKIEVDSKLIRPADVTLQVPDISKFVNETGWKSTIPFDKTLQDILDYYRENIK